MKKKFLFAIMVGLLLACNTLGQTPISIPIEDPDFESQPIGGYVQTITDPAGCGTAEQGQIAGWTLTHINPGSGGGVAHWTCDNGMPNSNVAFLAYGSRMSQLLTETAREGVYVLQFDVANWFYAYPGDWNAMLYQGTRDAGGDLVLSPAPFCNQSGWTLGDMKRVTVTCPLPAYLINNGGDSLSVGGQVKGNIVIVIQSGVANPALGNHAGWPVLIDNVALNFSPQR